MPVKKLVFGAAALLIPTAFALNACLDWLAGPVVTPRIPEPAERNAPVTTDADPGNGPLVALPDLSGIDRSLVLPPGLREPRYCLLVFGKREAKTRVWLVEDGDTLYVDRDGTGTLAGPGKAVRAVPRYEDTPSSPSHEWSYPVGDLVLDGGREKHTQFKVVRYHPLGEKPIYILWIRPFGKPLLQRAGSVNIFARDRESAPVIHFGGPVVAKVLRSNKLTGTGEAHELHFCVGTPGRGEGSFAYVSYESVPRNVDPVVKIRWPGCGPETGDRFLLKHRC
jgi:hypothetical protein